MNHILEKLLIITLLLPALSVAASPENTESAILATIDSQSDEAIQFLQKMVNINSGTLNVSGVRRVARLYAAEFTALGFT